MRFSLRHPFVPSVPQQQNNEDLVRALNHLGQFLVDGDGAPSHTPDNRQLYVRRDGGTNTTLYVHDGSSWVAVA